LVCSTIAKFSLYGRDYLSSLSQHVSLANLPPAMGGSFELFNEPFVFDLRPGGPFYAAGYSPEVPESIAERDGPVRSSSSAASTSIEEKEKEKGASPV